MIQWGNVAEWIAAIGTTATFIAGLVLLQRQLDAHKAAEEDRLKRHAGGVAAWFEIAPGRTDLYEFYVRNANPSPVYNCVLYASPLTDERGGGAYEVVFSVLPPESTKSDAREIDWFKKEGVHGPAVEVAFTDSEGKHWRRYSDGRLEQLAQAPATC